MSAQVKRLLSENEDFIHNRGYTPLEKQTNTLRLNFLKKYIINSDVNLYKTTEQRDWANVAKREYRYLVQLKSLGYALMISLLATAWRMYIRKSMVCYPLVVVTIPIYYLIKWDMQVKHCKRLFDMCNIGQQYSLGKARLDVLYKCNELLGVEDF